MLSTRAVALPEPGVRASGSLWQDRRWTAPAALRSPTRGACPTGSVGHRGLVATQAKGRPTGQRLVRVGGGRPRAAIRRRQRLRHPLRRGLRPVRRARPDPPSTVARVGHGSSPAPGHHDPEAVEHSPSVLGPPATPGSPCGSACTTSPCRDGSPRTGRLRRPAKPGALAAPRRLGGRDLRRPGVRLEADQRAGRLRPASATGWGIHPPGVSGAAEFAEALEAIHLANHEAWRLLGSGEPAGGHHPQPRDRGAGGAHLQPPRARPRPRTGLNGSTRRCGAGPGRCATACWPCPAGRPSSWTTWPAPSTDWASRTTSLRPIYADEVGPYPADARVGPMGYAPWPKGWGWCCAGWPTSCPADRCW